MIDNFRSGYTKALLDIKDYFEYHSESLKHNKAYNSKVIPTLINSLIENRDEMMRIGGKNLELILTKDKKFICK